MKISILKTHQTNGIWFHAGTTIEVNDLRAQDLIRAGLAIAVVENGEPPEAPEMPEVKSARQVNNKAASVAKNK